MAMMPESFEICDNTMIRGSLKLEDDNTVEEYKLFCWLISLPQHQWGLLLENLSGVISKNSSHSVSK